MRRKQGGESGSGTGRWSPKYLERIERAIARNGSRDLKRLTDAGVDHGIMLRALALATIETNRDWQKREMAMRKDKLRSLARQLEILADKSEGFCKDPVSALHFWAYFAGGYSHFGMNKPLSLFERDSSLWLVFSGMRSLAKIMRGEAARFARFMRRLGTTDVGVVHTLIRYAIFCPKMENLDALARLLTDAFEVAGRDETFSADGLRQTFNRHGKRLIRFAIAQSNPS